MADEQEDVNQEQTAAEQTAVAETSTTTEEVQTDKPAQSDPTQTGSEKAEATETATGAAESEQSQAQPKARPHRAPGAERRIAELTAKTKTLQAQLQAAMSGGVQPQQAQQPKPEDTEEFWTNKYRTAQTDAERQEATQRYTELHENKLVERAKREILGGFQRQQHDAQVSLKLAKLHERQPFLLDGGKIDVNSPLVQQAAALAIESGGSLLAPNGAINFESLLYFATEAALDMQGQAVQTTQAKLANQQAATVKATARTNLETTSQQASAKPTGQLADAQKRLKYLEDRRAKGGPMYFNSEEAKEILYLRQVVRPAAKTK